MALRIRLGSAPSIQAATSVPVVTTPTTVLTQILGGQIRRELANLVVSGGAVAGGGYNPIIDSNYGGAADGGAAAGSLLSTLDLTQDGAIVPRCILTASAARKTSGFSYNRAGGAVVPLIVGPDPATGAIRRTTLGAVEAYDNVLVDPVVTHDNTLPVWAWWGFGYRVFANGRYWGTGIWFFAQVSGATGFPAAAGGNVNWQSLIAADSVNVADPTPILYGPTDLGVQWDAWHRLGLVIDAPSDASGRVRWFIDGNLVDTFNGPTATPFDANANGLVNNFFFGYGAYKEDSTTVDAIEVRWHNPGAVYARTIPVVP